MPRHKRPRARCGAPRAGCSEGGAGVAEGVHAARAVLSGEDADDADMETQLRCAARYAEGAKCVRQPAGAAPHPLGVEDDCLHQWEGTDSESSSFVCSKCNALHVCADRCDELSVNCEGTRVCRVTGVCLGQVAPGHRFSECVHVEYAASIKGTVRVHEHVAEVQFLSNNRPSIDTFGRTQRVCRRIAEVVFALLWSRVHERLSADRPRHLHPALALAAACGAPSSALMSHAARVAMQTWSTTVAPFLQSRVSHPPYLTAHVVAVLFTMRVGLDIDGKEFVPKVPRIAGCLPTVGALHALFGRKRLFTLGKKTLLLAVQKSKEKRTR